MVMFKNIEALFRGYYKFDVNGKIFYLYSNAKKYRVQETESGKRVYFNGKHIFKGTICFWFNT
jgi:hypothetical protein